MLNNMLDSRDKVTRMHNMLRVLYKYNLMKLCNLDRLYM